MRFPTVILEGKKLQRVVFSIRPPSSSGPREISSLMRGAYERDVRCFDLPTAKHHEAFRELIGLTEDRTLFGFPHIGAEEGASLSAIPLHRFEKKVGSTVTNNLLSPDLIRGLKESGYWKAPFFYPASNASEVLTQKEIDRISFDSSRFDKGLAHFQSAASPFLFIGEKYGDWLIGLGRIDLLKNMVAAARAMGFIPILSGQWATFFLPKVRSVDAAAYAVPINKKRGFFDLPRACNLIKKFDRPVISLDPLADKELLGRPDEAFTFLFGELKISIAVPEVSSEKELEQVLKAVEKVPSLRPYR